jgi:hypothetical protein
MIRPVVLALWLATACSDPAPEVRLRRLGGPCGAAGDAVTLLVRALGDGREDTRAISVGAVAELADLPATTRQLAVEVLGGSGVVRAVGKTAPLDFGELSGGADIPIAMAPPGGACPTEPLVAPRTAPMMARAGRYILLLGGQGASGPLTSAELYDPQTDRFEVVEVPPRLVSAGSFTGAVATTLADGRVVVSGGPTGSYIVFDPETKKFGPPIVLERRFFHGAVALGGDEILVAGGCRELVNQACSDAARTVFRLAVDSDVQEPLMVLTRDHVHPTLLLEAGGIAGAGSARGPSVLVVGAATGNGLPAQVSDRIDLQSSGATSVPGSYAAAVTLDSGAVLTGFSAGGLTAIANAAILPPQAAAKTTDASTPLRAASLTLLEDGTVLALGDDDGGAAAAMLYRPTQDRWQAVALPPAITSLAGHRALRLDDGTVLIAGATSGAAPAATAWRFRPSLLGPFSASALPLPSDERAELTPLEPVGVNRSNGRYELVSSRAGLGQWAIAGGLRLVDGRLLAVVRPPAQQDGAPPRGLALISHFQSPGELVAAELVPGEPAALRRWAPPAAGAPPEVTELCRGAVVPTLSPTQAVTVELEVRAGAVSLRLGNAELLSCVTPELPRGAWGIGVVGAGAVLAIDTLTVER